MIESKFRFKNPELSNLEFLINDEFNEDKFEGIDISGDTKIARSKNSRTALVSFHLCLGAKNDSSPFSVDITMQSHFEWDESMDENLIDKLLKGNAPTLLLSYMRPIVSVITTNSKFHKFNIPYLDLQNNEAIVQEIPDMN